MANRSLLLVEDEVLLCWMLEEELRDDGYDVLTSTTGNEGMAALESSRPFDALVTNIRLEDGPDGWALAERARERNPQIAVLYVSGDSAAQHKSNGVQGSVMLSKPFEPAALRKALASLLAKAV